MDNRARTEFPDGADPHAADCKDVLLALAGDVGGFQALVARYHTSVVAVARASVRDEDLAQELAQETFIRAYLGLGELKMPGYFPVWIHRIVRNLAADWRRRGQTRSRFVQMIPLQECDPSGSRIADSRTLSPRDITSAKHDQVLLNAALDRLPQHLREVVLMHFMEDMPNAEIARRLGIDRASVGRRLERALKLLQAELRTTQPALAGLQSPRAPENAARRTAGAIATIALSPELRQSLLEQALTEPVSVLASNSLALKLLSSAKSGFMTLSPAKTVAAAITTAAVLAFPIVQLNLAAKNAEPYHGTEMNAHAARHVPPKIPFKRDATLPRWATAKASSSNTRTVASIKAVSPDSSATSALSPGTGASTGSMQASSGAIGAGTGGSANTASAEPASTAARQGVPVKPPSSSRPTPIPMTMAQVDKHIMPKDAPLELTNTLALIYNGYRHSMMEPCGCVSHQLGGMDKEAYVDVRLEALGLTPVEVDAGGFMRDFPSEGALLQTRYVLRALKAMRYDAMNVGFPDLSAGLRFLYDEQTSFSLPLISANVVTPAGEPIYKPYVVVPRSLCSGEKVRVGIIGVTRKRRPEPGADTQSTTGSRAPGAVDSNPEFVIKDPAESLRKYLPRLRADCDLIVAAVYATKEDAAKLINSLGPDSGIDVCIAGELSQLNGQVTMVGNTRVVSGGYEGRQVGLMLLNVKGGQVLRTENSFIEVVQELPPVPVVSDVIARYKEATGLQFPASPGANVSAKTLYAGPGPCKTCHLSEYKQWETTRHAGALVTLGKKKQVPNPECLKCHAPRGGLPSLGVTCEVCHGPAFQHVLAKSRERIELQLGKRRQDEPSTAPKLRVGFTKEFCIKCHDAANDNRFDYARDITLVNHTRSAQRPSDAPITQETSATQSR